MATRKVNGQKLDPKPTRREFASWLSQVEAGLTKRIDQLDKVFQLLAKSNQTIWNNQKELTKSEELLDEQFAVSTRMTIVSINHILEKMGATDRITDKDIEKLFRDWAQFRKRPDYREYMMEWFLGVALDKLPPSPAAEQAKKEGDPHVESDHGNQNAVEGQPQDDGPSKTANVPEVQAKDGAKAES